MKNKGFSLVELIVVIAIMAILVGVAVPVYSSYIEKTQKAKDEQMIDEIKHAIEIAAVGNSWYTSLTNEKKTGIGMIVIKENGTTVVASSNASVVDLSGLIEDAMEATFGATYVTDLKLSYDGWTGVLDSTGAVNVKNSAYVQNVSGLLSAVQEVTTLFGDIATGGGVSLDDTMKEYLGTTLGIDYNDPIQLSNAMVLYVSDNTTVPAADLKTMWKRGNFNSIEDVYVRKGAEYAFVQAMANRANANGYSALLTDFNEYISGGIENTNPMSLYNNHKANISVSNEEREADAQAYLAILAQVGDSRDVVLENANNSQLYKDSVVTQLVSSYVSVADVIASSGAVNGDVVLVITLDEKGAVNVDAYPIDY